jgi:uncharacterized SAM-binding protein YcdF (DUF218 family)
MIYVLSKLLGALLAPGTLLLVLLVPATMLLWSRRRWRTGRAILTGVCFASLGLVLLPIQPFLTRTLEDRFPANPPLPAHLDGVIILGGAVDQFISQARGRVTLNDAAERVTEAVILAQAHPEAKVLYTGGSADPWRPQIGEAPYAARLLVALGIDPGRLIVEDQSRNTHENAVASRRLVDPKAGEAWVLITSARHMPRSVGTFRQAGWPVIAWPVDYATGGRGDWTNADLVVNRLRLLAQSLHEWCGLVYYRLRGWSDDLFPAP